MSQRTRAALSTTRWSDLAQLFLAAPAAALRRLGQCRRAAADPAARRARPLPRWDWVAAELRQDWHIIAPDLRGHGDSAWPSDGNYRMAGYIYDLAQLIHQQQLAP